jgi:LysM repeat protein
MDHKNFGPMLDSFVDFASNELGIKSLPKITIQNDNESSFGGYNPTTKELLTSTKNRHPMDIFRTVAHELIHHKQNEEGRIGMDIAKEGSDGSDIENEANSVAGVIMRKYAKKNPSYFKLDTMTESYLIEGVNDPGIFKAVFLAGGPGSGKDFVMSQALSPFGLVEINSDNALEFLMKKEGLDLNMPKAEEGKRNLVRGRAKSITKEKERLALAGRLGVIINGTADSPEKIEAIKGRLEELGYTTKMVFVNTSNEVSQTRNIERGRQGGRKVPDGTDANGIPDGSPDIRLQKWVDAQKSKLVFEEMFGKNDFISFNNDVDMRNAPPDVIKKTKTAFIKLFKRMQSFATAKIDNPIAKDWIRSEKKRLQQVEYETTPKNYQYGQEVVPLKAPPSDVQFAFQASPRQFPEGSAPSSATQVKKPTSNVPSASEKDQAKSMGLSYYGFGRYGKNINGANVVTHISQDGKLIPKPRKLNENIILNEIFSVPGGTRSKPSTPYLASDAPYSDFEPELYDHSKAFSTKTHDVYWKRHPYSGDKDVLRGTYIAINKSNGKADIKVEGILSKHSNGKTQTFKASDLESREGSPLKAHDFYSHIMSKPHDGRGTIIQSDNVQTLGGEKTWKRLSNKRSVAVHSWDDTKDVAQDFTPKTPEDREHLYSTGTIDSKFSDEMSQVRRKLGDPKSIVDKDYRGAAEVQRKALISGMETASTLEKLSLDRTLVAYNPKTLNAIKEEKHVVTKGETIARIAMKHKTSPVLIAKENGLPSIHEKLKKNQELNVPKIQEPKEEKVKPESIVMSGVMPTEKPKDAPNPLRDAKARASKALQASLNAYGRKRLSEESVPKNPELWAKAKSLAKQKFDVYPSRYANQWASKWYKEKGGDWKTVEESNTPDDREWGTSSLVRIYRKGTPGEQVKEAVPLGYEFGNQGIGDEYGVVKSPTGLGMGYSIPMTEGPDKGIDTMGLWAGPKAETDKDILETPEYQVYINKNNKSISNDKEK